MKLDFEVLHHAFSLLLALLFSFYLILNKTKGRRGNIYLGLFLLILGLENLDFLLVHFSFYNHNPEFFFILSNLGFLSFPLFLFYIKSVAYKGFKLKWADLIHTLPFLLAVSIILFKYHLKPEEVQIEMITSREILGTWYSISLYHLIHFQALLYGILSVSVISRFKKIVKENYSNIDRRNYKWILQLTLVFVYFIMSALIYNIFRFGVDESYEEILNYVFAPITLIFWVWIITKALSQPYLFNGVDANIKLLKEYLREKDQLTKVGNNLAFTNENNAKSIELKLKIERYINEQEVYKNPTLTINELAESLGLTKIELSLFLNKKLNRNFFDFINEFRINKAMEILKDPKNKDITILEILYSVGFNSKSSFNSIFKRKTNLTPTQYRLKHSTHKA